MVAALYAIFVGICKRLHDKNSVAELNCAVTVGISGYIVALRRNLWDSSHDFDDIYYICSSFDTLGIGELYGVASLIVGGRCGNDVGQFCSALNSLSVMVPLAAEVFVCRLGKEHKRFVGIDTDVVFRSIDGYL